MAFDLRVVGMYKIIMLLTTLLAVWSTLQGCSGSDGNDPLDQSQSPEAKAEAVIAKLKETCKTTCTPKCEFASKIEALAGVAECAKCFTKTCLDEIVEKAKKVEEHYDQKVCQEAVLEANSCWTGPEITQCTQTCTSETEKCGTCFLNSGISCLDHYKPCLYKKD